MDANELRAMQAPIKQRYKDDPEAAVVTLRAKGTLDDGNIACKSKPAARWPPPACIRRPAAPGSNCAPATCCWRRWSPAPASHSRQSRPRSIFRCKSGAVSAEGDLDFRGTLGVAKDAPVGFREIRLRFDLDTDAPQDKLDQLLKLTERYCVVYQTIKSGPPVDVSMTRV